MAASDPTLPNPPPLPGRFQLLGAIGSGSSGTVHRARLREDYRGLPRGSEVAVKFLREDLLSDPTARARLVAEGELGRSLRASNVAAIYGVETMDLLGMPVTYLVMELVSGTILRDLIQRGDPLVEDLVRRIGAHAAAGLFALHRRGLVHRDIKPENLILTDQGQLKIVDLGLVRATGRAGGGSSESRGLFGSVAYAAPEILSGGAATAKSDLYALGVVLYEVATGQHPFAAATSADEMLHSHLHSLPVRPSHLRPRISPLLEEVLLQLLEKQPMARIKGAGELERILAQGERSDYWQRHEQRAPNLAGRRRLLRLRRSVDTPFFGRAGELAQLMAGYEAALRGTGSVISITGPIGMGRRRLCDEAVTQMLQRERSPLYHGGSADVPFGHGEPFASAITDQLLHGDDPTSPRARERAVHASQEQFGLDEQAAVRLVEVAFGTSTEPPEVRADRVASCLLKLASRQRPLVLRVDHAERLDTSGRLMLSRLQQAAATTPLLLLLVCGMDGVPQSDLRLDLAGLPSEEWLSFGNALFTAPPREEFLTTAHSVLSGLPGNLLETLDELAQDGRLQGRPGRYTDLHPDASPHPAKSHVARFLQRVAAFAPEHRDVLAAAAVLGERCQLELLAELVQTPPLRVLETLSLFQGRIVRAQAGTVTFRHPDFQRTLLRTLAPEQRRQLHLRSAELLAAQGYPALQIGMHRSMAFDHQGCLVPLLDALQERVAAGSQRSTLRLLGRLAIHFEQVPDSEANRSLRLRYLLLAGRARAGAGQHDTARKLLLAAEGLAHALGDAIQLAQVRTQLAATALDSGQLLSAQVLLETVHQQLSERSDDAANAAAAAAHGLHGRILFYLGTPIPARKQLRAALQRLPTAERDLRCHLHIDLLRVEALAGRLSNALATLRQVEQEAEHSQFPRVNMRLQLYRGQLLALLGDEEAAQDLHASLELSLRLSLPAYAARAALFRGERAFWRRADSEALTLFTNALTWATAANDKLGEGMARTYLLRLGVADPAAEAFAEHLGLPAVRANLLLAQYAQSAPLPQPIVRKCDEWLLGDQLALPMRLRLLTLVDRPALARKLVQQAANGLPAREQRSFLAQWRHGARP